MILEFSQKYFRLFLLVLGNMLAICTSTMPKQRSLLAFLPANISGDHSDLSHSAQLPVTRDILNWWSKDMSYVLRFSLSFFSPYHLCWGLTGIATSNIKKAFACLTSQQYAPPFRVKHSKNLKHNFMLSSFTSSPEKVINRYLFACFCSFLRKQVSSSSKLN